MGNIIFNIYGHCIQIWSEHVCDELWRSSECSENSQSSQSPMRHWQWKLIETSIEVDSDFGSKSDSKSESTSIEGLNKLWFKVSINIQLRFFWVTFFPVFLIFCIIFILNSIKSINVIHIIFTMSMTLIIVTITVTVTWHIWSLLWFNIY